MDHSFIRDRDIVMFSFQPWESEIGFNFKDMAYELAASNRVLFINRAADRSSLLKQLIRGSRSHRPAVKASHLQLVQRDLWLLNPQSVLESINWSPSYALFDRINLLNNRRLAREINQAIAELGFRDIIFINDNDFFRGLYQQDLVPCEKYIFYIRDYLTIQPFFSKYGPRCEKKMVERSDLVVANSAYLAEYTRKWNPRSFDIGQGCHLENFANDDQPVPADMVSIPRPVIGYCGSVNSMRLDQTVLEEIARSFPECSVVLAGPVDAQFEKSSLHALKNVFMLGGKPPDQIQRYIYHFDICINPQAVNLLTIGNYPRKIDEYLAAGKPVVATATEAMKMFADHAFLCFSSGEYVEKIRMILGDTHYFSKESQESRRQFALEHTWRNSIGLLGDAYHQVRQESKQVRQELKAV